MVGLLTELGLDDAPSEPLIGCPPFCGKNVVACGETFVCVAPKDHDGSCQGSIEEVLKRFGRRFTTVACERCHRRVGPGARTDVVGDGRPSDCQCDDPGLGTIPMPTMPSEIWLLIPWDALPTREIEKGGTGSSTPYGVRIFGTEQEAIRYSNGSPQWTISGPYKHGDVDRPYRGKAEGWMP
jgi:hypothetical protein